MRINKIRLGGENPPCVTHSSPTDTSHRGSWPQEEIREKGRIRFED